LQHEISKDEITIEDTGDNPDAPAAREMTDLEVSSFKIFATLPHETIADLVSVFLVLHVFLSGRKQIF